MTIASSFSGCVAALALSLSAAADGPRVTRLVDGREVEFGGWSRPVDTSIPAWPEAVPARTRTGRFAIGPSVLALSSREQAEIAVVTDKDDRIQWIGPAGASLVETKRGTIGVIGGTAYFNVLPPPELNADELAATPEAAAVSWLLRNPGALEKTGPLYTMLAPEYLFGLHVMEPARAGESFDRSIGPFSLVPKDDAVDFVWRNYKAQALTIRFDPNLEPLAALVEDKPVPLIRSPKRDNRLPAWGFPSRYPIPGSKGRVDGWSMMKFLDTVGPDGTSRIMEIHCVIDPEGRIWCGPRGCKVVNVGGALVGIRMSRTEKVIEIYRNQLDQLDLGPEMPRRVESLLLGYERTSAASGTPPSVVIDAESLGKLDSIFLEAEEVVIREVGVRDDLLEVRLVTNAPRGWFVLSLDPVGDPTVRGLRKN
ncbi:MAG: hypothetical protein JNL97_08310 [Verrucomicrobiales bacterium]|nr:hypothetical protein [Verrucomicrobiales bacterium]